MYPVLECVSVEVCSKSYCVCVCGLLFKEDRRLTSPRFNGEQLSDVRGT